MLALGLVATLVSTGALVVGTAAPSSALLIIPSAPTEVALQAAFTTANATADDVEIDVTGGSGVTVNLTAGPLIYNGGAGGMHALTMKGGGVTINQTTVNSPVFISTSSTSSGVLTLDGMTISGGNLTNAAIPGAAVFSPNGPLTLSNATVRNNTDVSDNAPTSILQAGLFGAITAPLTLTNVTIDSNSTTTSGAFEFGIAAASSATVTNSRFTNNTDTSTGGSPAGGTIDAGPDASTITNSTFANNTNNATADGEAFGILFTATTTVTGSAFTGNQTSSATSSADGTLDQLGDVTMSSSTVENNTVTSPVQAFGAVFPAALTMSGSTIDHNTVSSPGGTASGGGVATTSPVTVTNSTITDNTASGSVASGGGIDQAVTDGSLSKSSQSSRWGKTHHALHALQAAPTGVTLVYTTIVDNTASTGANLAVSALETFSTVVASPHGSANCTISGAVTSNGYNFSDDASCSPRSTGDQQNAGDPKLATIANAGGPTPTRVPQSGSPLIDAIPVGSCQADGAAGITTDQRGAPRPQGAGCDIGAVEVPAALAAPARVIPRFTG